MADMPAEELEEITYLNSALRSLIMMAVEPSVAATAITEKDPGFETFLNLECPPFDGGGRVG